MRTFIFGGGCCFFSSKKLLYLFVCVCFALFPIEDQTIGWPKMFRSSTEQTHGEQKPNSNSNQ